MCPPPHSTRLQAACLAFLLLPAPLSHANDPVTTPPIPPSPVTVFRSLLTTNPEARAAYLATRSPRQRQVLEAKLTEYQALAPETRELRLQATELRFYLEPLLTLGPAQRSLNESLIPPHIRPLVQQRLADWDALQPEQRRDLLAFDRALPPAPTSQHADITHHTNTSTELVPPPSITTQDPPSAKRDALATQFERFFELPAARREHVLGHLDESERNDIEATLKSFASLPPSLRRTCVNSFKRFSDLDPKERAAFLHSADRWREFTPAERDQWRRLVNSLPPLPPGFDTPPLPPGLPSPTSPTLSTRTN